MDFTFVVDIAGHRGRPFGLHRAGESIVVRRQNKLLQEGRSRQQQDLATFGYEA